MEAAMSLDRHDLEDRHWWYRGHRHAVLELGRRLVPRGGVVVQVSCGTGGIIGAFPAAFERFGLDPSPAAISLARERYPGVTFEPGTPPAAGAEVIGRASLVVVCGVLEQTYDDVAFLRSLVAMMRSGASLLLTVPSGPRPRSADGVVDDTRRYTRGSLARSWRGLPVMPRLLAPLNRHRFPLPATPRAVPWRPVNAALTRVLIGEVSDLVAALRTSPREVLGRGTGLIAVLERAPVPVWRDRDDGHAPATVGLPLGVQTGT